MTVCNMAIEAGARAGMIAADDKTIEYFRGARMHEGRDVDQAVQAWRTLKSDAGREVRQGSDTERVDIKPQVSWGTSPRW